MSKSTRFLRVAFHMKGRISLPLFTWSKITGQFLCDVIAAHKIAVGLGAGFPLGVFIQHYAALNSSVRLVIFMQVNIMSQF